MLQDLISEIRPYAWYGVAICIILIWMITAEWRKRSLIFFASTPNLQIEQLPQIILADANFVVEGRVVDELWGVITKQFDIKNDEVTIGYSSVSSNGVLEEEIVKITHAKCIGMLLIFKKGHPSHFEYDNAEPIVDPQFSEGQSEDLAAFITGLRELCEKVSCP